MNLFLVFLKKLQVVSLLEFYSRTLNIKEFIKVCWDLQSQERSIEQVYPSFLCCGHASSFSAIFISILLELIQTECIFYSKNIHSFLHGVYLRTMKYYLAIIINKHISCSLYKVCMCLIVTNINFAIIRSYGFSSYKWHQLITKLKVSSFCRIDGQVADETLTLLCCWDMKLERSKCCGMFIILTIMEYGEQKYINVLYIA